MFFVWLDSNIVRISNFFFFFQDDLIFVVKDFS